MPSVHSFEMKTWTPKQWEKKKAAYGVGDEATKPEEKKQPAVKEEKKSSEPSASLKDLDPTKDIAEP